MLLHHNDFHVAEGSQVIELHEFSIITATSFFAPETFCEHYANYILHFNIWTFPLAEIYV